MRTLLKLSGEALPALTNPSKEEQAIMARIAEEIHQAHTEKHEIAIVVGGGNIFRGSDGIKRGMTETTADLIGMLATLQNGLVLQDLLEGSGLKTRLMTGLMVNQAAEQYIVRRATRHLEKGRIVILGGGTGNGGCTTDYAAALRGSEIRAEWVAKATTTDGVYDKDPKKHPDAKKFERVSYGRCIRDDLNVMDTAAFALCREKKIPIRVFSLDTPGNVYAALTGKDVGTVVSDYGD
ncbi:UMP kinase [Patescibacteria group bacterium]|nr:UMP kinase [Patescibacteria group bacterium]